MGEVDTSYTIEGITAAGQERKQVLADRAAGERQAASNIAAGERQASAQLFASQEATRSRQGRKEAFSQFTDFVSPFLQQLSGDGTGADGTGYTEEEQSGLAAATAGIEQRGEEAKSKLSGALARRGIYSSGAGFAAEAKLIGATEAGVAQSLGEFAESSAERRLREKMSKRQALSSAIGGVGGGFL